MALFRRFTLIDFWLFLAVIYFIITEQKLTFTLDSFSNFIQDKVISCFKMNYCLFLYKITLNKSKSSKSNLTCFWVIISLNKYIQSSKILLVIGKAIFYNYMVKNHVYKRYICYRDRKTVYTFLYVLNVVSMLCLRVKRSVI